MSDMFDDMIMDWDSEISKDSEFVLLPAGEYPFKVVKFEKGYHNGSANLDPCKKAMLTIEVCDSKGQKATVTHNLFLHRKVEGLICAFFTAIGQRKHGEAIHPNWGAVLGSTGRCKVGVRNWTSKDGKPMQSNEIEKFLEPTAPTPQASGYTPGKF